MQFTTFNYFTTTGRTNSSTKLKDRSTAFVVAVNNSNNFKNSTSFNYSTRTKYQTAAFAADLANYR